MTDDAPSTYDVPAGGVDWEALWKRLAPQASAAPAPQSRQGPGALESLYNYLMPGTTQQQQIGSRLTPDEGAAPPRYMAEAARQYGGMPGIDPAAGQSGFNPFLYSTMPGGAPPSGHLPSPAYGVSMGSGKTQDYLGGGATDTALRRAQFEASRPAGVQSEFKTGLPAGIAPSADSPAAFTPGAAPQKGPSDVIAGVSEAGGYPVPGYQGGQGGGQGGGPSGFMHWQDLARELIKSNPGIKPEVAAMAIMQFMPLMNQQSQLEMRMISQQMGLELKGAQTELAEQRLEFNKQKQDAEYGEGGASLKHLEKARDQAEKADTALLRARTSSGADKHQQDIAIKEAMDARDAAYKRVAEIERTRNPEKFDKREKEQRVQQLTQYLSNVEQAVRNRDGTPEEALAQVAKSLPPQVVERLKKEGSTTEELAYLLLNPKTRDAALKVIGQQ